MFVDAVQTSYALYQIEQGSFQIPLAFDAARFVITKAIAAALANDDTTLDVAAMNAYLENMNGALDYFVKKEHCPHLSDPIQRAEILNLLIDVRKNERAYPDHIQVVTAQDSRFFAYQIIAKALFEKLNGNAYAEYEFLRAPDANLISTRDELFKAYPSLYLTKEEAAQTLTKLENEDDDDEIAYERFAINDTLPQISRHVVAVNLSLETCVSLDSALYVFIKGAGVSELTNSEDLEEYRGKLEGHIRELFHSAKVSKGAYEPYLASLIGNAPITQEGIVNQIFLPKDRIGDFLYMSFGGGFYHEEHDEIHSDILEAFQSNRLSPDFDRKDNIQARLLAGMLFEEDVRIIRYSLIPQVEQDRYRVFVQNAIDEIFGNSL